MINNILNSDTFRGVLKKVGVHHLLDFIFRMLPKLGEYHHISYKVDSLEAWLLEKEIFQERIYDGVFNLEQSNTLCDLGCNRGFFTLWAASKMGVKLKGLLIEANPKLIGNIQHHLEINKLTGCKVFNGAVGAGLEGGLVEFLIPPTDVGAGLRGVASGVLCGDKCETEAVIALNTGKLWEENIGSLTRCDLLKVDIEGAEWKFFQDEVEFLKLVDRLVVEVHAKMGDEEELMDMIRKAGFTEISRRSAGDCVYLIFAERINS